MLSNSISIPRRSLVLLAGSNWNDDDNKEQDDNSGDDAETHLHILPPHLLSHAIGPASESLGGDGEVVGLVLQ